MKIQPAVLIYLTKKIEGQTHYLMIHRNKKAADFHLAKYNGLGGKMELGESVEDTLRREVKEESGLKLEKFLYKGFIVFPDFDKEHVDWHVHLFTGHQFSGEQLSECSEGDLHWVKETEVPDLNLWEGDRLFLPWLKNNHFFTACFRYNEGKLVSHQVTFYEPPPSS